MRTIREATHSDLPSICALGEEVNAIHHRAFQDIFAGPGDPDRDAAHWLNSIGKSGAATFVAEESAEIVGFVNIAVVTESHSLLQPMRFGRIGSVAIRVDRRGQGIGGELMAHAHAWVTSNGGVEVRLNVWAFNSHALHHYKELGYEIRSHFLAKRLPSEA